MYEPYVPGGHADESGCVCARAGRVCWRTCDVCPPDCPERRAPEPAPEQSYDSFDSDGSSSFSTSRSSTRRRRYSSRRFSSASSSGSPSGSSSRSSGGKRTGGKKAGAGIGAAATAAAGGFGALQSGGDDPAPDPEPGYPTYSSHADPYPGAGIVERDVEVPIESFRVEQDGRMVVVTGTWRRGRCPVTVEATERARRVVLSARGHGEYCDPPTVWPTAPTYVAMDAPLGDRRVFTRGPLLDGDGGYVRPDGTVEVPRSG